VIAESWQARTILQFENGILATAIPPVPSFMMTKHAHPQLHKLSADLFSTLFGGEWKINNPFMLMTKRGCVDEASKSIGKAQAIELLNQTETCWFLWSNRINGERDDNRKKRPGVPCGVCIPCLIRHTAVPDESCTYDLLNDEVKNDPIMGIPFRSYFGFIERIINVGLSYTQFYNVLPAAGRELLEMDDSLTLKNLHTLFSTFAREFKDAYKME
jgi:hypothetical protein